MSTTTTTPINIIPTLDSQSLLTSPIDILGYVLRYYCTSEKSVSNTTYSSMISLADTASRYQANPDLMAQQVTNDLTVIYNRFFPVGAAVLNVTTSDNGDGSYNLTIGIAASIGGVSYTLGADVGVTQNGVLTLKWHPQLN